MKFRCDGERKSAAGKGEGGCCEPEELLRFLDGDLDARSFDRIRRHLRECAACRGRLDSLDLVPAAEEETHPDESILAACYERTLTGALLEVTAKHIARCDLCLDAIDDLRRSGEGALVPDPELVERAVAARAGEAAPRLLRRAGQVRPVGKRRVWVGIAVAVAASLLVSILSLRSLPGKAPVFRSEPEGGRITELALSPAGTISPEASGEVRFRWRPVDGAAFYRLRVLNSRGRAVAALESEGEEVSIRADEVFEPGELYVWSVEVVREDGAVWISEMTEFVLSPLGWPGGER